MKQWTLSQTSFDQFLAVLDVDREDAGRKYEELRKRIVKFFEWRACRFPDDLADETLDRVVRKIAAGVEIEDHAKYAYGVAKLVYLETIKEQTKEKAVVIDMTTRSIVSEDDEDIRFSCLERCLDNLTEKSRTLILRYYRDDKQAKIDLRKQLAEEFNISVNALRIKALRIRTVLEECVLRCLNGDLA